MAQYTVIGSYECDRTVFCHQVEATDAHSAILIAAGDVTGPGEDFFILGAIEGWHDFHPACEDSGAGDFAINLVK